MTLRRVVLHAHSVWSHDGHWTLAAIARLFGRLGADAVMMSEHDTGFDPARFADYRAACAAASTPRCRLVPGIEYSCPENDVHVLVWGLRHFLAPHRPVAETLARVREAGGVAVLAHPARRAAWRRFDPAWTPLLVGVEVWNRKTDGIAAGGEARALAAASGLAPTVGVDFHRLRHLYPLSMRGRVAEPDLEAGLCAALRAGRLRPEAFGRPLLSPDGRVRSGWHDRAEALRRRVRRGG